MLVWPRQPGLPVQRISESNEHLDPLTYALLFPDGMPGWHHNLEHAEDCRTARRFRLTPGQFYTHRLMIRDRAQVLPHAAGLLFQQYILDAYCRAEGMHMQWLRDNQRQLRSETLSELDDFVAANDPGVRCGNPIILPASFSGSPRNMYQLYLDAMAIVRKHGRPDFFITFTANPQWPEIQESLLPHQTAADRPDLVARVFWIRLQALLRNLTKLHFLGRAKAWSWVIEFQKRGLLHAHILLILLPSDRIRTAEDVDKYVAAEIPGRPGDSQAELAEIVARCMMHGPCGLRHPLAPCIKDDGTCKAGYPKEFQPDTILRADGYPLYRRRDDGALLEKNGVPMDNRDVVPYSPTLLKRHNAHLNIEVVASIRLVKYIFKYTFKGHDRARLEVTDTVDEIKEHLDARFLGATEAAWRLFEFPMHGQSHAVQRLVVHLPGQQPVTFTEGSEADALANDRTYRTTLTAWFALNTTAATSRHDATILSTLYQDLPLLCTWDKGLRQWKRRSYAGQRHQVVGRLAAVGPTEGERYYLYLLLLAVPGACSFEDLRTVDDVVYPTFQAAAVARGLCASDQHLHAALQEVLAIAPAPRARAFFAFVLACCEVADPLQMWEEFAPALSEDYARFLPADMAMQAALADIYNATCKSMIVLRLTSGSHYPIISMLKPFALKNSGQNWLMTRPPKQRWLYRCVQKWPLGRNKRGLMI